MSEPRTLFLVGFMGCGKSSVGRIVAARLGREFEDTDLRVEAREGRSIEAIFRDSGEGHFREAEWRELLDLGGSPARVVATGGGLFLGVIQRRFMKDHGVTLWLDAPLERIRARLGEGRARPLWVDDDRVQMRAFFDKRRAAYALADHRIDADADDPEQVAARVLRRLGGPARALPPLIFPGEW